MVVDEQALRVTWKTAHVTAAALLDLIRGLVDHHRQDKHGEQSLHRLNRQNMKMSSIPLPPEQHDLKAIRRELNRYSVDFSIRRGSDDKTYTVFFKAQDEDRVYKGMESCLKEFALKDQDKNKRPIREVLEDAARRSAEMSANRDHTRTAEKAERGRDTR